MNGKKDKARRKVANNPRARVQQIVRTLREQANRTGDAAIIERVAHLHHQLSGKKGTDPDTAATERIKEIEGVDRRPSQKFDAHEQRDLLLVVLSRHVHIDVRVNAGSLLMAEGDKSSRDLIHRAYPGLMPAIVKALK